MGSNISEERVGGGRREEVEVLQYRGVGRGS